jgi:hypothetical protein
MARSLWSSTIAILLHLIMTSRAPAKNLNAAGLASGGQHYRALQSAHKEYDQ